MRRGRGFTLIELLVVIAIIAILAGMLFPVFARARESARKIQCLSNVKNIAIAFQMYLTDYDRLPPREHRGEVIGYFADGCCGCEEQAQSRSNDANPYLRWPVVLDEYIKNREVWRCSSAKQVSGAGFILPGTNWFASYQARASDHCVDGSCGQRSWPPGWGGSVTDSALQGTTGYENGAFEQGVGTSATFNRERKTSAMDDPAAFIVCGDAGVQVEYFKPGHLAYPDVCKVEADPDCYSDWANCSWTVDCGMDWPTAQRFWGDGSFRARYARHLGGDNMGFADGHATWMAADAIYANMNGGQRNKQDTWGKLQGLGCFCRYCLPGDSPDCGCG